MNALGHAQRPSARQAGLPVFVLQRRCACCQGDLSERAAQMFTSLSSGLRFGVALSSEQTLLFSFARFSGLISPSDVGL